MFIWYPKVMFKATLTRPRLQREFGLQCWSGSPHLMERGHRHNDLELNLVERGQVVYLFGGQRVTLLTGELRLFWAATPHQMIEQAPDTYMHWLTVPLAWLLQRNLPEAMLQLLLRGLPLRTLAQPHDAWFIQRWQQDLQLGADWRDIVLLELEARLRRMATELLPAPKQTTRRVASGASGMSKSEAMARIIATKFQDALSASDIAREVGLHPNYAMSLFRQTYGDTFIERITQHRVAYAQQLLVTTSATILEIAMQAGFGSATQFYVAFKSICDVTPRTYRQSLQSFAES